MSYLTTRQIRLGGAERKQKRDTLIAGWKYLRDEVPALRESLENEFRALLGDGVA